MSAFAFDDSLCHYLLMSVGMCTQDGELAVAYQTLKDVNRVLQRDMEQEKTAHKKREEELRAIIEELRKDNDRQQDLIGQVSIHTLLTSTVRYHFHLYLPHLVLIATSCCAVSLSCICSHIG